MEKGLKYKSEEWKALPRNNAYEINCADQFYDKYILPLVTEKFLAQYNDETEHNLMYVTVGTSWQPIALSIMLHKPKHVVFLCTDNVRDEVDKALAYLENAVMEYEIHIVDKGDSKKLLEIVNETFVNHGQPKQCCFDITGGTKAMAAAAAMMAAYLESRIFYIESNYLPVYRHPEPGSEKLVEIYRPQDV